MNRIETEAGLAPTPGYRYADLVGPQLFVAGQVPLDASGQLIGHDDPAVQARQCLDNLALLLGAHQSSLDDIRHLRVHVVGARDDLVAAWTAVTDWFDNEVPPATLLGSAQLGHRGQMVEIEASVVRGAPATHDRQPATNPVQNTTGDGVPDPDVPTAPTGPRGVMLCDIDAGNWSECAELRVTDDQAQFVAPATRYLAMCAYGDSPWHPLAVLVDNTVTGFVMRAIDADENSLWIGGLLIDRAHQRLGHGRAAVEALIHQAAAAGHPSVALSYQPKNQSARGLYASLGFVETGETVDNEVVARLCPSHHANLVLPPGITSV